MYFIVHVMRSHLRSFKPVVGASNIMQHESEFILSSEVPPPPSVAMSPVLPQMSHCEKCTEVYFLVSCHCYILRLKLSKENTQGPKILHYSTLNNN